MTTKQLKSVAVIGGGTMGQGIAQVCAAAGFSVKLFDIQPELTARAMGSIRKKVESGVEKGKITQARQFTQGCAISQAGASMLFEQLEGMKLTDAAKLSKETVLDNFGELSVSRVKCALLGYAAMKKALTQSPEEHILEKAGAKPPAQQEELGHARN